VRIGMLLALRPVTPLLNSPRGLPVADQKSPAPPLAPGYLPNFRFDLLAGFLVFLIAMPLCLAIARASGYPPIAGIWTAVIGGIVTTFISNSELTIKGPAAGLIVIAIGAVTELGKEFAKPGMSDTEIAMTGYRLALGVGVVAGILQILLGLLRAGRLVDFFPLTPVHGMLASIGIVIILKQLNEVVGAAPSKAGPVELFLEIPETIHHANPEIALIGLVRLAILFGIPLLRNKWLRRIPAQMLVLLAAIPLGFAFDLTHLHTYLFRSEFFTSGHEGVFEVGPAFLVNMPNVFENPAAAFAVPDFSGVWTATGIKYILLYTLIGSVESLLSAKAIELIDPWSRKTDFNRDQLAIGVANTACAALGALPMISEIVRSKANIDNGARTRMADFYHALFLLVFVLAVPDMIHRIPNAALAAMLIYTGYRLASPAEFIRTYRIGSDQFIVFVVTIAATLATNLLYGIIIGIATEGLLHLWHGTPVTGLLRSQVEVVPEGDRLVILVVRRAAVFSNWLGLQAAILKESQDRDEIVIDLSQTRYVDHSVMEKLHELEREFIHRGKVFKVIGLDEHIGHSNHPHAGRKRSTSSVPAGKA
jgi:MFS superfamily sulfate permease-like transporter